MPSESRNTGHLAGCDACGAFFSVPALTHEATVRCPRCNSRIFRHSDHSIDKVLSWTLAALILFVVANTFPFLTLQLEGQEQVTDLISGSETFYQQGMTFLACVVFATIILVPALKILSMLAVVLPLKLGYRPGYVTPLFRWMSHLGPWAMVEVFLFGVIVSYVKLGSLAHLEFGPGFLAFVGLFIAMVASSAALLPHDIWSRISGIDPRQASLDPAVPPPADAVLCHTCGLVSRLPETAHGRARCPRCGDGLHRRKPNSLTRTWALVITAAILYIPANVFPVMTVISFGKGQSDTILSGVVELIAAGMWPIALIVFLASITVPMLKLIGLSYLLISIQRRSRWRRRDRTQLFHIIEWIGRWSMVDIFVISILIALVDLGALATIEPGMGATAFALVVISTIVAAETFDPRLIWDASENTHEHGHH